MIKVFIDGEEQEYLVVPEDVAIFAYLEDYFEGRDDFFGRYISQFEVDVLDGRTVINIYSRQLGVYALMSELLADTTSEGDNNQ